MYALGASAHGVQGGAAWVYGVAALSSAVALLLILCMKIRRVVPNRAAATWNSLLEGLRFVWNRKTVLGAISLDLFAVLFGGATALLPAYTKDVLHAGRTSLGI